MTPKSIFWRGYRKWSVSLTVFIGLFLFIFSLPAYADGGAPNLAYVAGTPSGVTVVDVGQRKVARTLNIPGGPHTIGLSQDGRALFVTEPQQGRVAALLAQTGQTICSAPVAGHPTFLTFDLNTNLLYVAANDAAQVTALDPATCQVKLVIHTNGDVSGLTTVIVSSGVSGSTGIQLWVAAKTLTEYDDSNGQLIASIALPGPQSIIIPPGNTLYVTTAQGEVDAVDLSSHQVETVIKGGSYGPMDYDAITDEVYVPDRMHRQIVVLNPATIGSPLPHEPNRIIHLATEPQSIAVTSDGQFGFIALRNGTVVLFDLPAHTVVTTIAVGGTPQFIITGLYPPTRVVSSQTTSKAAAVSTTRVISVLVSIVSCVLLLFLLSFFLRRRMKNRQGESPTQKDR